MNIDILPDASGLFQKAAEKFSQLAAEAVAARGKFYVVLSGGSTPKGLYALLADENQSFRSKFPWQETHFFWGDERLVPPSDPESNYRMAWDAMLSKAPIPPKNIHRVPTEQKRSAAAVKSSELANAEAAARRYERLLRRHFHHLEPGQLPRFDLILLGMGADGHTASLFPGSPVLNEAGRLAAAAWDERTQLARVTLTLPVINSAANILFLVSGAEKADALHTVLEGGPSRSDLPASWVLPKNGNLMWFADAAAAGRLSQAHARVETSESSKFNF